MFLKEVRLTHFRCIDKLTLSFMVGDTKSVSNKRGLRPIRQRTLLLGGNGTGKSNLLKAIALVTAGSNSLGELLGNPEDWIQYGKEFCEIEADLVTQTKKERHIKLRLQRGDQLKDVIMRNNESLSEIDDALSHSTRNYFVIAYGASRKMAYPGTTSKSDTYDSLRAGSVATLFNREASLNALESWAMDLDYREEKTGLGIVKRAINKLLPGIRFHKIDKKNRQLLFKTDDGIVPLELLSDGYQNMAAWIGDLLYRVTETFEDYQKPLNAKGLLLIDEVDLHLHPQWQRELLTFIGDVLKNFQIVVTTHSPFTAQQAGPGELHYLYRDKKKILLEQFTGNPKHLLVHQLIMSDIFGLKSDESMEMEKKKETYRALRDKKRRDPKEEEAFKNLSGELADLPMQDRSNQLYSAGQLDLLNKIKEELSRKG